MTLKTAAFSALVGMILLTVVLAFGFIRDISAFTAGAIAAMAMFGIAGSFAGKSEYDRIPVRVPQSAVVILRFGGTDQEVHPDFEEGDPGFPGGYSRPFARNNEHARPF